MHTSVRERQYNIGIDLSIDLSAIVPLMGGGGGVSSLNGVHVQNEKINLYLKTYMSYIYL